MGKRYFIPIIVTLLVTAFWAGNVFGQEEAEPTVDVESMTEAITDSISEVFADSLIYYRELFKRSYSDSMAQLEGRLRAFYLDSLDFYRKSLDEARMTIQKAKEREIDETLVNNYYNYINMLFDTEDEKVYPVTIGEANLFLNLFPQTKPAPDILFRLASSYEERKGGGLLGGGKEVKNAVVLYLKFLYFYPGSIRERDAQNRLKKLVIGKKDFEKTEQDILALIRKELSEKDKYLQYVDYLEDLARLNDDDIKELALTECNNYLNAFKEAEKDDQVIVIMGDLLSQLKRYEQAVSAYQKIEYLYPESYYYARALYNIGKLYAFQLKKRDEASNILQELVIKYPKDTYSGFAQYLIAELAEKKKKGERQAIAEYQKMVENYPQHLKTPDALLAMGRIYSVKLKQYQEAIKSYEKIAFQYPQSGMGGQALALAGEVYEKKLKRYNEAAEKYIQIADLFPQDSLVLPKLMEAAGLYESKVKERTKAINTYQRVISNFPGTKEAEGARKKIEKLK